MSTQLRIARVLHGTVAEGPGLRSAIWVQGCSIRCKGCINPHLFSPRGGTLMDPEAIVAEALEAGSEGLTFLGGEPFDQAEGLADLAELAHAAGLGVMTFTGYSYESLMTKNDGSPRLIAATDLLVDGPYVREKPEKERALVGSENQRFIHLTDRYKNYNPYKQANRLEVRIKTDGTLELGGFLDDQQLLDFSTSINAKRTFKRS